MGRITVLLIVLAGCTPLRPSPAVPPELADMATLPGYPPDIRFWGDDSSEATRARMARGSEGLVEKWTSETAGRGGINALVLSGGGSDGAFGAGLLAGWTEGGTRPEFTVVTGISTGAIIAPFAFLGPEYDPVLKDFYTESSTDTLVIFTPFAALLGRAFALTDTSPLATELAEAITPEVVALIAAEHRKGRRLQIGTTNLDAQRPVVWDIGAIAATGRADAPDLIRRIILASSAIPGAFPPVLIEVEAAGERWAEVHVDGGVTRQLFLLPPHLRLSALADAFHSGRIEGVLYVIRNTRLAPTYEEMELGVLPLAARSVSTLIKAAGVADVRGLADQSRYLGVSLRLAAVPSSFDVTEQELFDPVYMRALYDLGFSMAEGGYPWTDGLSE